MKTIVTMTSWKQRINMVSEFIYIFLTSQTIKPDIFYLWLSADEFPSQFAELPRELLLVSKHLGVTIKFCPGNDYVFKRWNVYPEHYNDLVISVDEDQFYDVDLIITRAGASTLAEIMQANLPSIIIPSPYVAGNHQYYNALDLTERGLAKMYEEKNLNVDKLYKDINNLLSNNDEYKTMKENLNKLNKVKSSKIIYDEIKRILK